MITEKRLAGKNHWQNIHKKNDNFVNTLSNSKLFQGYYHFSFFRILKKFWDKNFENFIEIGCAPGNYLVKFRREFGVDAFGIDYEEEGHAKTVRNVSRYGIPEENIILADFFDENFLSANREKFEVVFSAGFIEHFEHPEEVIKKQASLLSKNGLLICIIPNAKYLVEFLSDKKTISLHNQSIMNPEAFRKLFDPGDLEVKYCGYFGGLFNFGIFGQKKSLAKATFKVLFAIQRLTLDNLEKIYFVATGRDLICRYSSPSLLCIARKK